MSEPFVQTFMTCTLNLVTGNNLEKRWRVGIGATGGGNAQMIRKVKRRQSMKHDRNLAKQPLLVQLWAKNHELQTSNNSIKKA